MNGRKTLSKKIAKIQRKASKKPSSSEALTEFVSTIPNVDIGQWRMTEDSEGSLILYNFETGKKITLATKGVE